MLKRILLATLLVITGGMVGFAVGYEFKEEPSLSVAESLEFAQAQMTKDLMNNGDFSQSAMNTCSAFLLTISGMQIYWYELQHIWNGPNYSKIESDYQANNVAWQKEYEKALNTPSEYEGGSIAPLVKNLELNSLKQARFKELKSWGAKAK